MFKVPVCIFIFKRPEKAALIIDQISEIAPQKLYIIGDGPRNEQERDEVLFCRQVVENHINWPCEIIRDYASINRGVYENIAGGAKRVFQKEKQAIFLEDDNMPAISFFKFCEEMLAKYENEDKVLWIMGSNYLKISEFKDGASYAFTQNMLPCGWASWANKFLKYYDGEFEHWLDGSSQKIIESLKYRPALKKQEISSWNFEINRKLKNGKFGSWDYQMSFTLRSQNLFGIIPKYNQITNIGVDDQSIHGGSSIENIMTQRFCENETKELEFPLIHPREIKLDSKFERKLGNIILNPLRLRMKSRILRFVKSLLGMSEFESLRK